MLIYIVHELLTSSYSIKQSIIYTPYTNPYFVKRFKKPLCIKGVTKNLYSYITSYSLINMKKILSDKELEEIYKKGVGFVYNDFSKSNGEMCNKLHGAGSYCLKPDNPKRLKVEGSEGELLKLYFDSLDKAHTWLKQNRSDVGYSDCLRPGCLRKN